MIPDAHKFMLPPTEAGAILSECRRHRYVLWRQWDLLMARKILAVIGVNPSTADEFLDDQTIRRCIAYAKTWGFTGLVMFNLHSFRATDPLDLRACGPAEIETPEWQANYDWIIWAARNADMVLCAWGNHGAWHNEGISVAKVLQDELSTRCAWMEPQCLGQTKDGHPKHPSRLRKDLQPQPLDVAAYLERNR